MGRNSLLLISAALICRALLVIVSGTLILTYQSRSVCAQSCPGSGCGQQSFGSRSGHMPSQERGEQGEQQGQMGSQQILQMLTTILPMLTQLAAQQNQANSALAGQSDPGLNWSAPSQNDADAASMLAAFQATETAAAEQSKRALEKIPTPTPTATPTSLNAKSGNSAGGYEL